MDTAMNDKDTKIYDMVETEDISLEGAVYSKEQIELRTIESRESLTRFGTSTKVKIGYPRVAYLPAPYKRPSDKWIVSHVIPSTGRPLALITDLYVDPKLFNHGHRFRINFRTVQIRTNKVKSNYRDGKVDEELAAGWSWMSKSWNEAEDPVPGERGLYAFEPYFIVDTADPMNGYYQGFGTSEFAMADPYYFCIENLPEK